jgi:hypothetical protein
MAQRSTPPVIVKAMAGRQQAFAMQKCTGFGNAHKLKQLSHKDFDRAGTLVCVRPKMSPIFVHLKLFLTPHTKQKK